MSFGYGNGTTTSHRATAFKLATGERTAARFDNGMTGHIWAQLSQSFGQSGNGNLYFHGRSLYSYGSHYVAGYILPANGGDSHSRGVTLYNADSYSVSTSQHVGIARSAARGEEIAIPNLTILARKLDSLVEAYGGRIMGAYGGEPVKAEPAPIAWRKLRKDSAVLIAKHFESPEGWPGEAAAERLFNALGIEGAARRARTIARKVAKAEAETKAKAAADKLAAELADARRFAGYAPEDVTARVIAMARRAAANGGRYETERRMKEAEDKGREMARAAKAAKGRGWTRMAADVRANYRALREALPEFDAASIRHARRYTWNARKGKLREALATLAGEPVPMGSGNYTPRRGSARDSFMYGEGADAARELAETVGTYYGRPMARVMGHDPDALAASLRAVADKLAGAIGEAEKAERRADARRDVATIRAGVRAMASEADSSVSPELRSKARVERIQLAKMAEHVAWRFAPAYGGRPPYYRLPGAWRLAGWTPERVAELLASLTTARRELESAIDAEKRAEAERVKAERAELESAAREAWRNGGEPVTDSRGARVYASTCEGGGALLRAEGVERDASGAIVGGELRTSQSATVPLVHALRAFRFLKLCRANGKAWQANGRTLRVGHFAIDSVDASGNFVAGCHKIQWAEVARLAEALGVAELAAEDATESHAHA